MTRTLTALFLLSMPFPAHASPEALGHITANVVGTASMTGAGRIIYGLAACGPDTEPYACPENPQTTDTLVLANATWAMDDHGDITVTSGDLMTYADFTAKYGIAGINAINQQGGTF